MAIIGFFVVLGLLAGLAVFEGFALKTLWAWFVVPTFGLPELSIPVAIGIALIVSLLAHQQTVKFGSGNELEDAAKSLGYGYFAVGFSLFAGWLVTFFM